MERATGVFDSLDALNSMLLLLRRLDASMGCWLFDAARTRSSHTSKTRAIGTSRYLWRCLMGS